MGRHCQVCTHAAVHRINRELLGGAKLQPTAIHYGVPLTSLHRHRSQCLGLSKAETAVSAPSKLAGIRAVGPAEQLGPLKNGPIVVGYPTAPYFSIGSVEGVLLTDVVLDRVASANRVQRRTLLPQLLPPKLPPPVANSH
jgi:hypothetical protein